ncbi:HNH endonuclease [Paenibacillus pinihumi]|uniref:HNH endonuclease n=1 Tax=Paenibacillus pinihumi TaxID=669462 RepID=UPI003CCC055D
MWKYLRAAKISQWSGAVTHIHHVRPRNLGGTNDFNNLIPIPAVIHESRVSPLVRWILV